ncbi:MAG: emp24/gp25L/p24 family protein [Oscillospiraceae bacterium]|nr:emp24/gp25L/p24 family protein [Oscillospiraceae bacterium]
MNAKVFSEAITELDDKYYEEAASYQSRKRSWRTWNTVAACLAAILVLCGFGYGISVYWGVGSTENVSLDDLTQPFGTVAFDQETQSGESEVFHEKSELISDYTDVYAEDSVCVTLDGTSIPSIYFSPNYMVIFTQQNEEGWELSKGDELTICFTVYEKLQLDIGYILNGEYYDLSTGVTGPEFSNTISAPEDGTYYFCVTNRSSSNAIITYGEITKSSE